MTGEGRNRTLPGNVTRHKVLFVGGAVWELLRFCILVNVLSLATLGLRSLTAVMDLTWFGAPQLVLAAGFFVAGIYPDRAGAILPLLRLGKFLSVVAGAGAMAGGGFSRGLSDVPWSGFVTVTLLGILIVDLILLVMLFLRPRESKYHGEE